MQTSAQLCYRQPSPIVKKMIVKRFTIGVTIVGIAAMVLGGVGIATGIWFNTTKSIPVGFYLASSAPVEKGAYVLVCPPQTDIFEEAKARNYIRSGPCHGGYGYMMKRVLAAKNDILTVSDDGVYVNDIMLPLSKPLNADLGGRPLPRFRADNYTLGKAEILIMSDVSGTSFDSRYFGPINISQIKTVIRPVVNW